VVGFLILLNITCDWQADGRYGEDSGVDGAVGEGCGEEVPDRFNAWFSIF
jgi:hypothetical protein